jgi:hypothetical protein
MGVLLGAGEVAGRRGGGRPAARFALPGRIEQRERPRPLADPGRLERVRPDDLPDVDAPGQRLPQRPRRGDADDEERGEAAGDGDAAAPGAGAGENPGQAGGDQAERAGTGAGRGNRQELQRQRGQTGGDEALAAA